jgi:hypothetical protein
MRIGYFLLVAFLLVSCTGEFGGKYVSDTSNSPSEGKGGSMARFAIRGDALYTVSTTNLKVFNIEEPANPRYSAQRDVNVGFDIETIFPMDTLLFIGSRTGMYVYDITQPQFPHLLSAVQHFRSCDPVVAQGNYAYVTLNTNFSSCGASTNNVLDIYNITNPAKPVLQNTVQLSGPMGLGIDGDRLFVCDQGLTVFDLTDPVNVRQIDDLVDIDAVNIRDTYDVIPVDGLLILVAKEGLYQFDYTGTRIKFVSKIEINKDKS